MSDKAEILETIQRELLALTEQELCESPLDTWVHLDRDGRRAMARHSLMAIMNHLGNGPGDTARASQWLGEQFRELDRLREVAK